MKILTWLCRITKLVVVTVAASLLLGALLTKCAEAQGLTLFPNRLVFVSGETVEVYALKAGVPQTCVWTSNWQPSASSRDTVNAWSSGSFTFHNFYEGQTYLNAKCQDGSAKAWMITMWPKAAPLDGRVQVIAMPPNTNQLLSVADGVAVTFESLSPGTCKMTDDPQASPTSRRVWAIANGNCAIQIIDYGQKRVGMILLRVADASVPDSDILQACAYQVFITADGGRILKLLEDPDAHYAVPCPTP